MDDATLRKTPLHAEHERLGAKLVPFAGFHMPVRYEGVVAEHHAVRQRAGIFDVSHMGELLLEGDRALDAINTLITNDIFKLVDGQALYTVCCNAQGTILDDLIVYRLSATKVLVVCNASNVAKISKHIGERVSGICDFRDLSDETALLALQGPMAEATLRGAGAGALADLKFFHAGEGEVAGYACRVGRTGYTGEDGFEIFCANEDAPGIFRALLESGDGYNVVPVGLGARDTLRLEAKLSLYGNDIDETTNPIEAGLSWVVKLDAGDFIGRDALVAIKEQGLKRKLVGFEMTGRGIARHGYPVLYEGEEVGVVTSGSPAPTLDKNIGLAYVPKKIAKIGKEIDIQVRRKVVRAKIVKTPFYRRQKP